MGYSTVPGYVNRNNQRVIRKFDIAGTDNLQYVYELVCENCSKHYGSNGSDNFQHKCPWCQSGADGLRPDLIPEEVRG